MSRAIFAAGALLASASLVQAGDHASFSPDLKDTPAPVHAAPAPAAVTASEAAPAPRARGSRRRTRVARGRAAKARVQTAAKAGLADRPASLTIGAIPAPLPPSHGDGEVSEAVATLEQPSAHAPGSNVETAARTPHEPGPSMGGGPREAPSETVAQMLARHAQANGVPIKLAMAVVRIESRGNPRASNHGALGLMQIKYGTARAAGFAGPAMGLFVAETNLRFGMKILGQAYKAAGGDTCGALMRYQSGHLARHMNASNRAYCSKARAFMAGA